MSALQVKQQYNAILAAKEAEAAARAQLALADQQLQVSIARVNAGAANVSDSLNSVVAVGNAQINILSAQQNSAAASAALTRLVGTPYLVTAMPSDTVELPRARHRQCRIDGVGARWPGNPAIQAQITSAQAQQRSARTAYLPTVGASANFSGNGAGKPTG